MSEEMSEEMSENQNKNANKNPNELVDKNSDVDKNLNDKSESKNNSKIKAFIEKHRILHTLFKTPMILVFLVMVAFFGLGALSMEAEVNRYAIVTAVGFDYAQDDENTYEVSVLLFVPVAEQSFAETYKVISAKGKNVSEAIDFIGLHVGREVGLSHVKFIVLNEELLNQDVSKFLDYLLRSVNLSTSTKLIATDIKAKDFLSKTEKLDSESSIKVSEIITYNVEYIYAIDSSLETFFKESYGPTRVGFISKLETESDDGQGITASVINDTAGTAKSQEGGAQGSKSDQQIVNNGDTYVFKDGKKKVLLTGKELSKISLLRGKWVTGTLEIEDFTDKYFTHADLSYEIFDNSTNYNITYESGIPVIYVDVALSMKLAEADSEEGVPKENIEFLLVTPEALHAIEKEVKTLMADGLEIMRDNQTDLADFYTMLYNNNKKAFLSFLEKLDDPEDYLNRIIFKVGVRVNMK